MFHIMDLSKGRYFSSYTFEVFKCTISPYFGYFILNSIRILCTPLLSLLELQCQCREMSGRMYLYRKLQPPLQLGAWIILFFSKQTTSWGVKSAPHDN